jgi:type II secretory pathway predicted ATPase ExeA
MNDSYRAFFGLTKEPFGSELGLKEILETSDIQGVKDRFDYAVRLGAVALVTGEIGSGKSTALRYAAGHLHPSVCCAFHITATSGSIIELYRQLLGEMGADTSSFSKATLLKRIRREITELVCGKRIQVVVVIDEASLLRIEVLAEIHTLCQFEQDSKPWLTLIMAGQANLVDKLMYRTSMPLASRIVARSHLEGVNRQGMEGYLKHHLAIAGVQTPLFDETAVTAIHQGAGGLFRKANHLARGSLIAAAQDSARTVCANHVRLAATELF